MKGWQVDWLEGEGALRVIRGRVSERESSSFPNRRISLLLTLATFALAETFLTSLWREEVSAEEKEEEEAGDIDDEEDELDGVGVNITAVNLAWLSCPLWRKEGLNCFGRSG